MLKIKYIMESIQLKSAEDFIRKTISGTEWENKVFAAGGYVRDELLGKQSKDLDVVVDSHNGGIEFATWMTKKVGNYKKDSNPVVYPTYGTAKFTLSGVIHNGVDLTGTEIEAVMPRSEIYTPGSRKPEVSQTSLQSDVNRRDLTVNSLLKNLSTGEILDLTNKGKDDLKNGVIRTPLDPDQTFIDDPLRMLRVVRFYSKFGWKIPVNVIRSLKKNASQLENISKERIRDELDKMLVTNSPHKAVKLLKVTGLLKYVMPEILPAIKMVQNAHHKHDVFDHTLDVLKKTNPVLVQRLMALFHDIGKTVTKTVTPTGIHFYGHEDAGEKIAEQIMKRLKYPNEIIDAVKLGVKNHMRLKAGGDDAVKLTDKALRRFKFEMGSELENMLDVIHADNIAHAEASSMPNQIKNVRSRLEKLDQFPQKPKLPINGHDLIQHFNLKPSETFSKIMSAVTDAWFENPKITKEQAFDIAKKIIEKE